MKQLSKNYNKAIAFIKEDRLEEAKWILESILASAPFHSETNWTAGLVEMMMGNPAAGLTYWERVNASHYPQLQERKEQVLSTVGAYEEIRAIYNDALVLVKEKKTAEAERYLSPLFQRESTFPLQKDLYKLYFIVLFENGKTEQAFELFSKAPAVIQKAPSIKQFIHAIKNEVLAERTKAENEQANELSLQRKKKRKQGRTVLAASVLAAVVIGGIYMSNREWNSLPANNQAAATTEEKGSTNTKKYEQEISKLQSKLSNVESEKESLKKQLDLELSKVSQYEKTENLLNKADLDLTSLRSKEARQEFNSGYALYQKGDLSGAKEKFELSLQLDPAQYFSDDSLFFFIQIEKQLGTISGASELFQQFFSSKSEHFIQSPYQDDLLVIQADAYYREGKEEEALTILSQVQEQFPAEWTASYAKRLAKVIQEG